jgi:HAE1 family hydrophobic/amphiphilic exporter-1
VSPRDFEKESRLPRFSLDRRITVLVLALTLAVVGVVAGLGIPAELFPRGYSEPFLWVSVPWTDAPPQEVLDKVTIPLEEEFGTIKGVDRVTSVSLSGMSRIFLAFKQGTDMDVAYRELRDRIERARARFPDDIDKTFIHKEDVSDFPIYMVGIAVDEELDDPYELIRNEIMLPLERVEGVASLDAFGLEEKEILIELDRERAAAHGLNIYELAMDLGDDNFTMSSGSVYNGPHKLMLRSVASYASIEALEDRLVAPSVRLRDVAIVNYDEPEQNYRARVYSKPAVAIRVLKEAEANTREVCRAVEAAFARIQTNPRLASMEMTAFFSQGDIIDESLGTLRNSGLIGGLIAALVLFTFMRRIRLTLIVVLSIPLSLLFGLSVMYFWGETLNLLTLIGLMICVGLLVDNSVVVAENIHRLHREGMSRRDACIRGAGEVGLAITMSTLTTIVVFLPTALVEGPAQFFLLRLAIPVAVSVAGSLVVALVFIPLCVYLTLPSKPDTGEPGAFRRAHERLNGLLRWAYDATFGRLNDAYNKLLALSLRRRFDMTLGLVVIFALTIGATDIKFVGQQEDEQAQFEIDVEMPENSTLEETEAWFLEAEKVVEAHKDELALDGWFVFHRKIFGEISCWFDTDKPQKYTAKEAMEIIAEALPEKPGMTLYSSKRSSSRSTV